MSYLSRVTFRPLATRLARPPFASVPHRCATSDYGSKQSGYEQGINEENPKKHLEHPGPEPPSTKAGSGPASHSGDKDGASPKIQQPKSANEDQSEDVKKHNEDMEDRHEKSANQVAEDDSKVNKEFWTGDVGDTKNKNG